MEKYKNVVGAISIIIGVFFLIFGQKFLKATFVIIVIIAAILLSLYGYYYLPIDKTYNNVWISIGIGFLIGIIAAYFVIQISQAIYICIGGACGYAVGNLIYAIIFVHMNKDYVYPAVILSCVIIFAFISFKLSKHLIIITTSLIGSYLTVRGLSFYLGHFPSESVLIELIKNNEMNQLKNVK